MNLLFKLKTSAKYYKGRCSMFPSKPTCDTKEVAKSIVKEVKLKSGIAMQSYDCMHCGKIHLVLSSEVAKMETESPHVLTSVRPRSKKESKPKNPCSGSPNKKIYDTFEEAVRAAKHAKNRWGNKVRPYGCEFCGNYHLTSH